MPSPVKTALNKRSSINLVLALATLAYQGICIMLFALISGDTVAEARIGYLALGIPGGLTYLVFLVGWWIFLLSWKKRTRRIIVENGVISFIGGLLNLLVMGYEAQVAFVAATF